MEPTDQSTLDLANHVAAAVKRHARPWRAIIALVLALAAAFVSGEAGGKFRFPDWFSRDHLAAKVVAASTAAAFCLFAVVAVIGLADKAKAVLEHKAGSGHAAVVRYAILLIGGIFTLFGTLALFKVPVGQFVVGGALTTILIGIAAQQSLSNVFAGVVLLLSRPFTVGDGIVVRSGALNGPIEGTVIGIGITYVALDTPDGVLHLPNSQVLASGVGRQRLSPAEPPRVAAGTVVQAPGVAGPPEHDTQDLSHAAGDLDAGSPGTAQAAREIPGSEQFPGGPAGNGGP